MTTGKTVLESVIPAVSKSNGDYYGKDGLLYCGKCHTPKEAFFAKNFVLMGKNRHPVDCRCRKMEREQQEVAIRQQKHNELVRRLKAGGSRIRQCSTGTLKTTMVVPLKCITHTAMWSNGRPCVQRI